MNDHTIKQLHSEKLSLVYLNDNIRHLFMKRLFVYYNLGRRLIILYVFLAQDELIFIVFNYCCHLSFITNSKNLAVSFLVFIVDFVLKHLQLPLMVYLSYIYLTLYRPLNFSIFDVVLKQVEFLAVTTIHLFLIPKFELKAKDLNYPFLFLRLLLDHFYLVLLYQLSHLFFIY